MDGPPRALLQRTVSDQGRGLHRTRGARFRIRTIALATACHPRQDDQERACRVLGHLVLRAPLLPELCQSTGGRSMRSHGMRPKYAVSLLRQGGGACPAGSMQCEKCTCAVELWPEGWAGLRPGKHKRRGATPGAPANPPLPCHRPPGCHHLESACRRFRGGRKYAAFLSHAVGNADELGRDICGRVGRVVAALEQRGNLPVCFDATGTERARASGATLWHRSMIAHVSSPRKPFVPQSGRHQWLS